MLDAASQRAIQAVVAPVLYPHRAALRVTRHDSLHVTLHFFGALTASRVDRCRALLTAALAGDSAVPLVFGAVGAFPTVTQPRALFVSVMPSPELDALHARLREVVAQVAPETIEARPFQPHVTIARVRRGAEPRLPEGLLGLEVGATAVLTRVSLVETVTDVEGSHYVEREAWPLAAPRIERTK